MKSEAQQLPAQVRVGDQPDLGRLLGLYSNYLKILAQSQLDRRIRHRISPSDVVQETMLEAHRDFASFRGTTDAELLSWLRRILVNNLMRVSEQHLQTGKRDVRREISLQHLRQSIECSNTKMEFDLADKVVSPSSAADRQERLRLLADALAELPDDQRSVIVLRHIEGLPFNTIAVHLERTSGACRMLWLRAIDQLRSQLQERDEV